MNNTKSKITAETAIFSAFKILKENGSKLRGKYVVDKIRETVEFNEHEKHKYEIAGHIRWESVLNFHTIVTKKLLLILFCFPILTLAQQTYIPDDNFETELIALGLDTFPLNDSINTAAIDTVKSLYIISNSIIDLTGIEGFIALEELDCSLNNLYNIDVQSNLMLEELYIIGNPISALNLDYNINLTYLHIGSTGINYLDLSNNINLEWFNANSSSLDTLILGNKPSLNYITATNNI